MRTIDDRLRDLGLEPIGPAFVPLSADEINEVERRLESSLPTSYRYFLERYGRSRFFDSAYVQLPDASVVPIMSFFGGGDRSPLLKMLQRYQEQFPQGTLPIATDPFGNLFVLTVTDGVWYANFNEPAPPPSGPGPKGDWYFKTVRAADSFEDFLDRVVIEADEG